MTDDIDEIEDLLEAPYKKIFETSSATISNLQV